MEAESGPRTVSLTALSRREREVVIAISRAMSTREIAQQLGISVRTVESHVWHAFRKLGVHTRVELVRLLVRHNIVSFDDQ